jgi:hypothetical protein
MNKALVKKIIFRTIGLAILIGGAWYGYQSFIKQGPSKGPAIATAKVQRGDVVIRAYTRGELKAVRIYPVYAPNLNGTVQVTALAPMGALAREKDLLAEYDDSELLGTIDADKLSLDNTDWSIKASELSMQVSKSQNKVRLLSAEFSVRRAGLNLKLKPVKDEITGKGYTLSQEEALRTLDQQKNDVAMLEAQQDTQLQVLRQNRTRAQQQLNTDMNRLRDTRTLAPMKGLIAIKQNRGGNFNFGQQMPDIRTGDTLQAGMNVMDILDLSEMALSAKVGELDRANLKEGQPVSIQLDSVPDKRFPGAITSLSGSAVADVFSGDPSKKFDVGFSIDMRALLLGVGMKESDVNEIINTAAANAKKNLVSFAPAMAGGRGGGGMGGPGGMAGMAGMGGMGGGGGMAGFGGGGGGFGGGGGGGFTGGGGGGGGFAGGGGGGGGRGGGGGGGGRGGGGGDAMMAMPPGGPDLPPDAAVDAAARAAALQAMQGRGGQAAGQGGAQAGQAQGRGAGRMSNMSDEDTQKLSEIRQKMQAATGADREKLQAQQQEIFQKYGMGQGRGGDSAGGARQGRGGGDSAGSARQGRGGDMAGGGAAQGRGGDAAGAGRRGRGGDQGSPQGLSSFGLGNTFNPTQEERDKAKLPPPPDQDSEVTKLLRPGLLADVEVEVEKIPNAIHVPKQAVMDKNNQTVVFVQLADGKFAQRVVKVVKQSESMAVLESGVQPGELVAMSDPTANKNDKSKTTEEKKSSSATSMMPGGK